MRAYDYISFTTDYGLADGFVAACHGVALTIAPQARLIDVTHLVPAGDIRRAAAVLAQAAPWLPRRTVHVAVVDPGVGTSRRAIALETEYHALVGPDNGVLAAAADALGGPRRAVELTNHALFLRPVSNTFHGRDVFTPVAAHLARGAALSEAGPDIAATGLVRLPEPVLRLGRDWLEAEVLTVDRFGNVQFAAGSAELARLGDRIDVAGATATRGLTFGSVAPGAMVVYLDSADRIAIAVNGGNAAAQLGVSPGDTVRLGAG